MKPVMRISPNDAHPAGPNPVRVIRFMRGMSNEAFSDLIGLKLHDLMSIESGRATHLRDDFREGFEKAGIDFDDLRRSFATWRDTLNGAIVPDSDPLPPATNEEAAIRATIAKGIRGVRAIARDAQVPYGVVRKFLQEGM